MHRKFWYTENFDIATFSRTHGNYWEIIDLFGVRRNVFFSDIEYSKQKHPLFSKVESYTVILDQERLILVNRIQLDSKIWAFIVCQSFNNRWFSITWSHETLYGESLFELFSQSCALVKVSPIKKFWAAYTLRERMYWRKCSLLCVLVTIEIQSTCCELSVLFWTITMATECFLYSSLCIIIGRPGDDISSTSYSMSHTLSTGPFGSTSLVTTTAGNGIPFGAVPFLLWSLFLLIGWTVELNLRVEPKRCCELSQTRIGSTSFRRVAPGVPGPASYRFSWYS